MLFLGWMTTCQGIDLQGKRVKEVAVQATN
jgi:hypothetical protein